MDIEPEKEVLIMVAPREKTDAIVEAVNDRMKISEPGNGIMMVQEVSKIYGTSI